MQPQARWIVVARPLLMLEWTEVVELVMQSHAQYIQEQNSLTAPGP